MNEKKFTLRMPIDLYRKLVKAAQQDRRSINAEILAILEQYLDSHQGPQDKTEPNA